MKNLFLTIALTAMSFSISALTIDSKKSELKWKGTKVTGEHFGKIAIKKADLKSSKGQLKSGSIIVDMNSITIDDLNGEWADKFLGHIKSNDFFEVEKYPTSKLEINSIEDGYINGNLTIKGKTNPVKFAYTKNEKTYTGKLTFDRTKYDMVYGSGNFFKNLGDKTIHDQVTLDFKIVLQ